MASISRPTFPVAPTTATLKPIFVLQSILEPAQGGLTLARRSRRGWANANPPYLQNGPLHRKYLSPPLLIGNARQFNDGETNRKKRHASGGESIRCRMATYAVAANK